MERTFVSAAICWKNMSTGSHGFASRHDSYRGVVAPVTCSPCPSSQ